MSGDLDVVSLLTYPPAPLLTAVPVRPLHRIPTSSPTSQTTSSTTAGQHLRGNQEGRRIQSLSFLPSYAVVIMLTTALIVAQQQHVVIRTV